MKPYQVENILETSFCNKLDALGLEHIKLNIKGRTGFSDRLIWIPGGRPLLVELKRPGEMLRPKQQIVTNMLRELGYWVYVCDNLEDAVACVERTLKLVKKSNEPIRKRGGKVDAP